MQQLETQAKRPAVLVRMAEIDRRRLEHLANLRRTSMSTVIRQLIREAAKREDDD